MGAYGRRYSGSDYRFGFNGKENDGEWEGQLIQDYGFRLYNPSIGKFLSFDPLAPDYPMLTPYQFASNTPIRAIDLDGLEAEDVNGTVYENFDTYKVGEGLNRTKLYFVAGAGNDNSGWNYVDRFKNIWTEEGVTGFTRLDASTGKMGDMHMSFEYSSSPWMAVPRTINSLQSHTSSPYYKRVASVHPVLNKAVQRIADEIENSPLRTGDQLNLAGYSYGSIAQAHIAIGLSDLGIKVDNLILIGSPISSNSDLFQELLNSQNIRNVIRIDIEGDMLSDPAGLDGFIQGGYQNSGTDGPHFDLARPGEEADNRIREAARVVTGQGIE